MNETTKSGNRSRLSGQRLTGKQEINNPFIKKSLDTERSGVLMFLKRGAEAVVKTVSFEGMRAVLKERVKKSYRIEQLDNRLRFQRTRSESRITGEAKRAGVNAPAVYFTDEKNFKIYLELVEGLLLKDAFAETNDKRIYEIARKWGLAVAKLHTAGIIHGDLTTSNLVVKDGELYFLDFGLAFFSKRDEDAAEDINLLYQSLKATHSEFSDLIWEGFLGGYSNHPKSAAIIKRAEAIAKRGRYSTKSL